MKKNPVVSIIIVHYRIKKELFACIRSIYASNNTVGIEIIVVDNDEKKTIRSELLKKYPQIIYVKNPVNNGWGSGTNLGVKHAKGTFLYFLNPDTLMLVKAIDNTVAFMKTQKHAGVVSSLLLDGKRNPYPLQGTLELTPIRAIFAYSFLNTRFPNNPISAAFWCKHIKRDRPFPVETPILSASMIRKTVFKKVGNFDSNYFLYFEENDLGKRLAKFGYQNYINTDSRVVHFWEGSTKFRNDTDIILRRSRTYYFRKYYGPFIALLVDVCIMLPIYMKQLVYGRMG